MNELLLIIPAYNEAKNIEKVVDNLILNYPEYDYIVVNDDLQQAAGELTAVLRSFRLFTSTLKKELFQ